MHSWLEYQKEKQILRQSASSLSSSFRLVFFLFIHSPPRQRTRIQYEHSTRASERYDRFPPFRVWSFGFGRKRSTSGRSFLAFWKRGDGVLRQHFNRGRVEIMKLVEIGGGWSVTAFIAKTRRLPASLIAHTPHARDVTWAFRFVGLSIWIPLRAAWHSIDTRSPQSNHTGYDHPS